MNRLTPEQYGDRAGKALEGYVRLAVNAEKDETIPVTRMVAFLVEQSVRAAVAEERAEKWAVAEPVTVVKGTGFPGEERQ